MSAGNGEDRVDIQTGVPGEGAVNMIIAPENGRVVMRFERPMLYVVFERDNAAHVGREIINAAVAVGAKVQINVPRVVISREKHAAMVARAVQINRSMHEQKKDPLVIARTVVDQVLAQIDNLG